MKDCLMIVHQLSPSFASAFTKLDKQWYQVEPDKNYQTTAVSFDEVMLAYFGDQAAVYFTVNGEGFENNHDWLDINRLIPVVVTADEAADFNAADQSNDHQEKMTLLDHWFPLLYQFKKAQFFIIDFKNR